LARANPLPYSKAIQIGTNICQTNTKPWNKRIADIELNLKKLREEIIGAYISWEGKIVLEKSPKPTPLTTKANTDPIEEKAVTYSDWASGKTRKSCG
jgi:hypothetical protein